VQISEKVKEKSFRIQPLILGSAKDKLAKKCFDPFQHSSEFQSLFLFSDRDPQETW
jgi:hypothetical protein